MNRNSESSFRELELPDGTYIEQLYTQYEYVYAVDQDQNLWTWSTNHMAPKKIEWFCENDIKVLEVACTQKIGIVKTRNKDGKLEMYAYNPDDHAGTDLSCVGAAHRHSYVHQNLIARIDIDAESVTSFAATRSACFYLTSKKMKSVSMIK